MILISTKTAQITGGITICVLLTVHKAAVLIQSKKKAKLRELHFFLPSSLPTAAQFLTPSFPPTWNLNAELLRSFYSDEVALKAVSRDLLTWTRWHRELPTAKTVPLALSGCAEPRHHHSSSQGCRDSHSRLKNWIHSFIYPYEIILHWVVKLKERSRKKGKMDKEPLS